MAVAPAFGGRRAIGAPRAFTVVLALAFAAAACSSPSSGGLSHTPGPGAMSSLVPADEGSPEPSGTAESLVPSAGLTSPARGLVLHVDQPGLGDVTGFRLLISDGAQADFTMGVQENAAEFPAADLSEHMASGQPVLVYFRQSGSDLVVYRLEDASLSLGSPQPPPASIAPPASGLPISSPFHDSASDAPAAS
jgi:hypothetical protein